MPSLLTLLLFCDFLESRLLSSNLGLLRRMLSDFYAGNEHTLRDFVRLGVSIVAVMPVERARRQHQTEAARLLTQQQRSTDDYSHQQSQLCVFRYLAARVASRNIFWLRAMFDQFCDGRDELLREFVRRGNEAISLIPAEIQPLQGISLSSTLTPQPVGFLQVPELATDTLASQEQQEQENSPRYDSESDEDREGNDSEDGDEITTVAELASAAARPPSLEDVHTSIIRTLDRLEEQEPWTRVFNPDALPFLFSGAAHPKLAAKLKTFWTRHARAVWERRFWGPLANLPNRRRQYRRKLRQSNARQAFQEVMKAAYQELGAGFFAQLDQRAKPHKGWWYLEHVRDLGAIAQHVGLTACLRYMESQALERFPTAPSGCVRIAKASDAKSKSMRAWTCEMRPILGEISAIKAAKRNTNK